MRAGEESQASFASLLRRLRRAAGLTQEALAERARLSWRSVSNLERGATRNPHRDTVALLVEALGIVGADRAAFEAAARGDGSGMPMSEPEPEPRETGRGASPLPSGCYLGALPSTPMVAREVESVRIAAALRQAANGVGRLVLLSGEPGVGKTRLAQETMVRARDMGYVVLVGRCYEEHKASPFFPFLEALAAAWNAASPVLRDVATVRYRDIGLLLEEPALPTSSTADDARLRVLAAVTGFLRDLAEDAPLALLFDDLHWVDGAALDLFLHLARALHGRRIFLLGSYRDMDVAPDHPLTAAIAAMVREGLVELVALSSLPLQGTAEQIGAYFGVAHVPDDLAALIHSRTAGNPFFTTEVLKALIEQGALDREGGNWDRAAAEEMTAPFSIRAVVAQRVGRLSPAAQDLLRLAGVLGQEFELDVLLAASARSEEAVLDELDVILAERLLEERRYDRYERYAFVHELVARTLCDELPRYRLRRLHLRAAEALERARGGRPETAAETARHFLEAGSETRALRYLELAGDHAARLFALDEAAGYYRSALDIHRRAGDLRSGATIQRKLGATLATAMKLEEARAVLDTARVLLEETGDAAELALVHHTLARAQGMDARARIPHFARALELWPADRDDDTQLQLVLGMAEALGAGVGNFAAAAPYFKRAALLAERTGSTKALFNIVFQETMARFEQGTPATEMFSLLDRGDLVAERAGELSAQALFTWFRGFTHLTTGDLREAKAQFASVTAIAGRRIMPNEHAQGVREGGLTALLMGDWLEAQSLFAEAGALHPIALHEQLYRWASGDHEGTLAAAGRGIADLKEQQSVKYLIGTLSYLADFYLDLGLPHEAQRPAREAWELARLHGLWMHGPLLYGPLVEAVALMGTADAAAILAEGEAAEARLGHFLVRPSLLRAKGILLAAQDRAEDALAVLSESATVARKQGAAIQSARTLLVLENVARAAGSGSAARGAVDERRAIVERIGSAVRGMVWAR